MTLYLGIDPGFDGAVAVLDGQGNIVTLDDTPTFMIKGGVKNKRQFDITGMKAILHSFDNQIAALEAVHCMPEQGITGAFAFGRGLGIWEGLLVGLGIPVHMVTPQKWKKSMMEGMGKEKDASRMRALQLFPKAELHLKKHHNRADALLMAEHLRRLLISLK